MTQDTVVVLTALNLEYDAVRRRLTDPRRLRHERGTHFEVGTLRGTRCRIALAATDKGNQPAAVLAERAIQEFDPTAVLFVGVAGALWDATALGDVVVATHVYAYHGGTSEDDGLKARPRAWETEHELSQLARHVARMDDWRDDTAPSGHRPNVRFGPIAAGEIVHNSRISHEAEWIRQHYNDALAIEMESAGAAQAGHLNGSPVGIVRGISDKADGTKNTDDDGTWQPRAADNAAAFAARLAEEITTKQEDDNVRHRDRTSGGDVTNTATGSTVGIQAKNVHDSTVTVTSGQPPQASPDLATQLAELRAELDKARSNGTLDSEDHQAAQDELDLAGKALKDNTPDGKKTFRTALKRLRGVVAEAGELATRVATLITAVNSLP